MRIAFVAPNGNDGLEIYLVNADGSERIRLTDDQVFGPSHLWSPACMHEWSPDGKQIAYASNRDGDYEIYVVDVDSLEEVRVTNHPADDGMPAWSPDGKRLSFSSTRESDESDKGNIYVMNADGTGLVRLTNHTEGGGLSAWQPTLWDSGDQPAMGCNVYSILRGPAGDLASRDPMTAFTAPVDGKYNAACRRNQISKSFVLGTPKPKFLEVPRLC